MPPMGCAIPHPEAARSTLAGGEMGDAATRLQGRETNVVQKRRGNMIRCYARKRVEFEREKEGRHDNDIFC